MAAEWIDEWDAEIATRPALVTEDGTLVVGVGSKVSVETLAAKLALLPRPALAALGLLVDVLEGAFDGEE